MKKFFLFASAALVLASCSSEAEEAVIKPNETPAEEVADLVEIKLGGTRASASTEASTRSAAVVIEQFNDTKVGIYAVDEAVTADPFETGTVMPNGITPSKTVILDNVESTAAAPASGTISVVNLDNTTYSKWYYPRSVNAYRYTFFGYYPYSPSASIANDSITIPGTFDGSQDVMLGRATSVAAQGGYCAKYFRENTSAPAPEIKFEHMTAQIVLCFKKGNGDFDIDDNNVVEAYFVEPTKYDLVIKRDCTTYGINWSTEVGDSANVYAIGEPFVLSKAYKANNYVNDGGNFYKITSDAPANTPISTSGSQQNGIKPENPVATEYPVFVPAQGGTEKTLHIKLFDGSEADVTITAPQNVPPQCFDKGFKYKVVLTINGPQQIMVNTSVEEWTEVTEDIKGEI